jgi:hypothetical protein
MSRTGMWRYTLPATLKVTGSAPFETRTFALPRVYVTPELYWWDLTKGDPSGSRHVQTHPAFKGVVGSGMGELFPGLTIFDFNDVDISTGSGVSDTRCMTFRIADQECWQTRVTHMKVWVSDDSDFLVKDYRVLYHHSQTWQSGYQFQFGDIFDPNKVLATGVPELQNLYRQDGGLTIHASGDADVSEYMYLALACSGTVLPGQYGGLPSPSGFRLRVTFSMDNIYPLFD